MKYLLLSLALIIALPAHAVEPNEVLSDAALEERARSLSRQIRCVVCQGETIDESNATIAKEMRVFLREELVAGASDDNILKAFVERYGEQVLMTPFVNRYTIWLWASPILILVFGVGLVFWIARRAERRKVELSEVEKNRLDALMNSRSEQ